MKILNFVLLFLSAFIGIAHAEEATINMSLSEYEKRKSETDSLRSSLLAQQKEIDSLNHSLSIQKTGCARLTEQLGDLRAMQMRNDSLRIALIDSLSMQATEIKRLNKEISSMNMVRLRYANVRLQVPYDRQKTADAIELFNGISDPKMRNDYGEILSWLNQYGFYRDNVLELFKKIQSDDRRTGKFEFENWRSFALNEINQNRYVRDSQHHDYTITFLDELITIAKSRITKANKPTVDFSDLIERLQL